ncbi:MAG: chromosome partitioning protein ParB, partial [Devosia sp.]|nr:chromosome partitioning protein ParB [Devosia sp.]
RDAEALSQQRDSAGKKKTSAGSMDRHPDTIALERRLSDALGLSVSLAHGEKGGKLEIRYKTLEQLDGICGKLTGHPN